MLSELLAGLSMIITDPVIMFWCVLGLILGTIFGALPGLGPVSGIALLLPLTFFLDQISAIILLISIYAGAMYGGRISAILINVPGDAGAIVSTFEGYPMTKKGQAGYALTLSAVASFVGGMFGFLALVFLTPVLAEVAMMFGPAEYSSLLLFTILAIGGLTSKKPLKPIIAALLGLLFSTVGADPLSGKNRFTLGIMSLWDGIDLAVMAIGIFGLAEVLFRFEDKNLIENSQKVTLFSLIKDMKYVVKDFFAMIRGGILGLLSGILPGTGSLAATFMSYTVEKKISKNPEEFGKGASKGLSGPESANNASVGGSLIPTIALGIPGSNTTAVLMGGLMMVGLQPGPLLFEKSQDVLWPIFAGVFIGNILLLILNIAFVPLFAKLIQVSQPYLIPLITVLCFVGAYVIQNRPFDIILLILFGLLGFFMRKSGLPLASFFLAFMLGGMLEENIRVALSTSIGSFSIFFTRPISLAFIILTIVVLLVPVLRNIKFKKS